MMTEGKRFYVMDEYDIVPQIIVRECDRPTFEGVIDEHAIMRGWNAILSMASLRKLCRTCVPRFQARMRERRQDIIACNLHWKDWVRARRCNYGLKAAASHEEMPTTFLPEHFLRRGECTVILLFSREQHRAVDPLWVDTVLYLPIGTFVLPANGAAPSGSDSRGWLWVKYRLTLRSREEAGWMHPHVIRQNQTKHKEDKNKVTFAKDLETEIEDVRSIYES